MAKARTRTRKTTARKRAPAKPRAKKAIPKAAVQKPVTAADLVGKQESEKAKNPNHNGSKQVLPDVANVVIGEWTCCKCHERHVERGHIDQRAGNGYVVRYYKCPACGQGQRHTLRRSKGVAGMLGV